MDKQKKTNKPNKPKMTRQRALTLLTENKFYSVADLLEVFKLMNIIDSYHETKCNECRFKSVGKGVSYQKQ